LPKKIPWPRSSDSVAFLGSSLEEFLEVRERHVLALRDVAQVGARRQEDRRRKRREQVVREVELEVEPGEVASLRLLD
jgi:hypothetical protein